MNTDPQTGTIKPRTSLPILSVTSVNRYRACPKSYFFANIRRMRPLTVDENRRFGTLCHLGLEAWWRAAKARPGDLEFRLEAALAAIRAAETRYPFDLAKAVVLMIGYHLRWAAEPLEVLDVEVEFNGDLRNPVTSGVSRTFLQGGKIDAIVRAPNGLVYTVEHKTSGEDISGGSEYWQRLTLDSQVSAYMTGARMLGHDPAGCIYDVIAKPRQRPLRATPPEKRKYTKETKKEPSRLYADQRETDETPEEYAARVGESVAEKPDNYYRREVIVRMLEEEREGAFDFWTTGVQIRQSMAAGIWPRNSKSCFQYENPCDYFSVCAKQADINDPTKFRKKEASVKDAKNAHGATV